MQVLAQKLFDYQPLLVDKNEITPEAKLIPIYIGMVFFNRAGEVLVKEDEDGVTAIHVENITDRDYTKGNFIISAISRAAWRYLSEDLEIKVKNVSDLLGEDKLITLMSGSYGGDIMAKYHILQCYVDEPVDKENFKFMSIKQVRRQLKETSLDYHYLNQTNLTSFIEPV
tara:strand:- start:21431 stop:21940 length:510 start_codon:yes stop_codon:yes gene_type:complete